MTQELSRTGTDRYSTNTYTQRQPTNWAKYASTEFLSTDENKIDESSRELDDELDIENLRSQLPGWLFDESEVSLE